MRVYAKVTKVVSSLQEFRLISVSISCVSNACYMLRPFDSPSSHARNLNLTQLLDDTSNDKDFKLPVMCFMKLIFSRMQTCLQLRLQIKE
jgi:hypothetical protein